MGKRNGETNNLRMRLYGSRWVRCEFVKHVQLHARDVHDMIVTPEQAVARAQTIEAVVDV